MTEKANHELVSVYIRLYFDEDVSIGIAENLRQRGFDALCVRDVQMLQRDDDTQLSFAISEKRAIVTHNRHDFELLHKRCLENNISHFGIIIAKRRAQDTHIVTRLLTLLDSVTADEMRSQLHYI